MLIETAKSRLKEFLADTSASMSLEAVIVFPFLVWAYVGSFVFFDAFRAQNSNMKAAYTISDMLSRETDPITADYIDGLQRMYDFLVFKPRNPTSMRVTVVRWDEDANEYVVEWSQTTNGLSPWTTETFASVEDRIPVLANGDTGILVEANTTYIPVFNVGFTEMDFNNFIFTSPRFAPRLCWETCLES